MDYKTEAKQFSHKHRENFVIFSYFPFSRKPNDAVLELRSEEPAGLKGVTNTNARNTRHGTVDPAGKNEPTVCLFFREIL